MRQSPARDTRELLGGRDVQNVFLVKLKTSRIVVGAGPPERRVTAGPDRFLTENKTKLVTHLISIQ